MEWRMLSFMVTLLDCIVQCYLSGAHCICTILCFVWHSQSCYTSCLLGYVCLSHLRYKYNFFMWNTHSRFYGSTWFKFSYPHSSVLSAVMWIQCISLPRSHQLLLSGHVSCVPYEEESLKASGTCFPLCGRCLRDGIVMQLLCWRF